MVTMMQGARIGWLLLVLVVTGCDAADSGEAGAVAALDYRVVARFAHDPGAFTQGLAFADGALFEGTGEYGGSSLRRVALATGRVLQRHDLPERLFGEGITPWEDWIVQLTWRARVGLIYDRATLTPVDRFTLPGEGWGITHDGRNWIISDGSAYLSFMDPERRVIRRRVLVRERGRALRWLNELEYTPTGVWANVWRSDRLVRIDPASGAVTATLDLSALWPRAQRPPGTDVLNGIAYAPEQDLLYVTGKRWPWLYALELLAASASTASQRK